jgi:hypothetical protein
VLCRRKVEEKPLQRNQGPTTHKKNTTTREGNKKGAEKQGKSNPLKKHLSNRT